MEIILLAAGAAGMYCGSCLRDNALARAMMRIGHHVTLVPLYTPLRTDGPDESVGRVFYGGINVYLAQMSRTLRRLPGPIHWLLNRPALLRWTGRLAGTTSPEMLGELTVSILAGPRGRQADELRRLLAFLGDGRRPDAVILPNAMFLGLAEPIRNALGCAVVCELTGEDIFLQSLPARHQQRARELICKGAEYVDALIATSAYYAGLMQDYLGPVRPRIDVVTPGVDPELFAEGPEVAPQCRPDRPTVGYMARCSPDKGLGDLVDAFERLRDMPGLQDARLIVGGWVSPSGADRQWYDKMAERVGQRFPPDAVELRGEVDLAGKLALLRQADVLCVPTARPEPKGLFALEAWAGARPFAGYAHGSLPELLAMTEHEDVVAGALSPPGDSKALAETLEGLLGDEDSRRAMGAAGLMAARRLFTADRMAADMGELLRSLALRADDASSNVHGSTLHE